MSAQLKFGEFLRNLRKAADRSMGEVARELGITTVYYSEVENGRKNPFPEKKVNYEKLARFLHTNEEGLQKLAEEERQAESFKRFFEKDFEKNVSQEKVEFFLQFARRAAESDVTMEELNNAFAKVVGKKS